MLVRRTGFGGDGFRFPVTAHDYEVASEEQESLILVLQRRLSEQRRADLVKAVKGARREFKAGRCRPAEPGEIMKKVLS